MAYSPGASSATAANSSDPAGPPYVTEVHSPPGIVPGEIVQVIPSGAQTVNSLWRYTRHRKAQRKATAMAASHHGSRQRDRERPGRLHLRCAREAARNDPSGVARVERGRWRMDTSRRNPRQCLPDDTLHSFIHSFIHSFVHSPGLPFLRTCQASSPSLCWHRSRWLEGMTRRGLHT